MTSDLFIAMKQKTAIGIQKYSGNNIPLDDKTNKNGHIVIHNALVNAAQGLLLSEKRILMLALTKLVNDEINTSVKLEATEFSNLFNIEINTAYEQIKYACQSMIKKQVSWFEKKEKDIEKIEINWVSSARYAKGRGLVEISFTPQIQKYLVKLKKHFTSYKLQHALALRSIYSWRLLEILSQFKSTGWREIKLDDFQEIMETTEKQNKNFSSIRRKIIEPAIKELKNKNGWDIEWKTIKKEKKVISLIFKFKEIN